MYLAMQPQKKFLKNLFSYGRGKPPAMEYHTQTLVITNHVIIQLLSSILERETFISSVLCKIGS